MSAGDGIIRLNTIEVPSRRRRPLRFATFTIRDSLYLMSALLSAPRSLLPRLALSTIGLLSGCSDTSKTKSAGERVDPQAQEQAQEQDQAAAKPKAIAVLSDLGGSGVKGTVELHAVDTGVKISAEIRGLTPNARHGFHVHEKGDCSAPDGSSAGGHFNPAGVDHGDPGAGSHAGDLGNLESDADGRSSYSYTSTTLTLGDGGPNDVVGRALIVHEGADDLKSQPTGDAGGRSACAVIERR